MGYFDTPEEAGRAYDMKLVELHGDDAAIGKTNFGIEDYVPAHHTAAGREVPPDVQQRSAEIQPPDFGMGRNLLPKMPGQPHAQLLLTSS
ncbi:hypothetical protein MNEG_11609 [Monoraphidium neglectum]|uniref:AP2/ERF domain-containing protein n=1 Tax=Monoraphidium neglectum TaxID=145388 RepID=A0A0D2LY68_9CHLO|nr:hypothetical protein MNEG_11609 [Monoraphidium neglectum]KIY96354.1 hypothetical protein MNEG_11609 [Monoraphidium neglectum]|eukprot:XP_013895374.1 hypothetical protein MNEG_11609 [Monoraphidium neglectum]